MKSPIPQNWEVPQVFRDRMGSSLGRQRIMAAEGHLLIILHDPPDADEPTRRGAQAFWRSPDGYWKSTLGRGSSAAVLRDHQQRFVELAERLEERAERASSATEYFAILREVTPALRTSRNAHRTLQEARQAPGADRELISVRDSAAEIERTFELLHGYAKDSVELLSARNAEQSARNTDRANRSGHQLNMIMALFLPITAVGSILGMNMRHGLEDWNSPFTFWIVTAVSFAIGYSIRARLPKPEA